MGPHLPKRFVPSSARSGRRVENELPVTDIEFNGPGETALRQEGLRDTDTLGIADTNNFCLHKTTRV